MNLIENCDFFVRLVPFPAGVKPHGMVMPNDDGTFSIYLDARVTHERQKVSCDHEIKHIENGDFWNEKPIEIIENI